MLIDLHAHSKAISKCSRINGIDNIELAKSLGLNGFILTNHYDRNYIENNDYMDLAKRYIQEYYDLKEYGDKHNFKVYFGIEVTLNKHNDAHILVYGVEPSFLLNNPKLYDLTQKELYSLVKENKGILVYAHPYRDLNKKLDINYVDGIEVNCHPLYKNTYSKEIIKLAKENHKILTCGADYHHDTYRPKCGVYIEDDIDDIIKLKDYLINSKEIKLCIHEVDSEIYDYIFRKE